MDTDAIINQNKKVYNHIADHFSDTRSFLWEDLAMLKKFVKSGDKVLDIGCGNGRLYQLFEDKSSIKISFSGLDISEGLVSIAKENYPSCEFVVGDMRNLPFDDSEFDVVFSLVALHHLPDHDSQLQALKEVKRVLKKDGKAILLNWNAYSDWVKDKLRKGDYEDLGKQLFRVPWKRQDKENQGDRIYYGFKEQELKNLFAEAGLNLLDQYFLRHGEKVGIDKGMNIVSILDKR